MHLQHRHGREKGKEEKKEKKGKQVKAIIRYFVFLEDCGILLTSNEDWLSLYASRAPLTQLFTSKSSWENLLKSIFLLHGVKGHAAQLLWAWLNCFAVKEFVKQGVDMSSNGSSRGKGKAKGEDDSLTMDALPEAGGAAELTTSSLTTAAPKSRKAR